MLSYGSFGGTIITGILEWWTTWSLTLPSILRRNAPSPRFPSKMHVTCSSLATLQIASPGEPNSILALKEICEKKCRCNWESKRKRADDVNWRTNKRKNRWLNQQKWKKKITNDQTQEPIWWAPIEQGHENAETESNSYIEGVMSFCSHSDCHIQWDWSSSNNDFSFLLANVPFSSCICLQTVQAWLWLAV